MRKDWLIHTFLFRTAHRHTDTHTHTHTHTHRTYLQLLAHALRVPGGGVLRDDAEDGVPGLGQVRALGDGRQHLHAAARAPMVGGHPAHVQGLLPHVAKGVEVQAGHRTNTT